MSRLPADVTQIETLARRARWLDRYRRVFAVVIALVVMPCASNRLEAVLGAGWPHFHITLLALLAALSTWCVAEVGLAWITAVWETECDRFARDRGLPRAHIVIRK